MVVGDRGQSASTRSEQVKRKKKKSRALTTAALLTLQLLLRLEGLAQTLQVEHPTALTLTRHQLLTGLLTHLQPHHTRPGQTRTDQTHSRTA